MAYPEGAPAADVIGLRLMGHGGVSTAQEIEISHHALTIEDRVPGGQPFPQEAVGVGPNVAGQVGPALNQSQCTKFGGGGEFPTGAFKVAASIPSAKSRPAMRSGFQRGRH